MAVKENIQAHESDVEAQSPTVAPPPPPPQHAAAEAAAEIPAARGGGGNGFGVSNTVRRWRREDLIKRGSVLLRGLAMLFAFLAFIITATNKHGDWRDFDKYQEYKYLLAIAILTMMYTAVQAAKHVHEISTGRLLMDCHKSSLIDFFGDQIAAYLLISAVSAAIPMTNRMRDNVANSFTEASATAISMAFFGFITLALSAMICGYKLCSHSYI